MGDDELGNPVLLVKGHATIVSLDKDNPIVATALKLHLHAYHGARVRP